MTFTKQQIADWKRYEKVRLDGRYNMIVDPRTRIATGLSSERYRFVLTHYTALAKEAQ